MGGLWFLFYFFIENECMFFELGIIRLGCMCVNTPSLCRSEGGEGFALPIVCRDNIYIRRGGVVFLILLVDIILWEFVMIIGDYIY